MSLCVLSTKKLSEEEKNTIEAAGVRLIHTDFIRTQPLFLPHLAPTDFVIITSQQALHALELLPKTQKIMCVGEKTKQKIKALGFEVVQSAPYGAQLAELILQKYAQSSFLFLSGSVRSNALPALVEKGVRIIETHAYTTEVFPQKITQHYDAVLFFSPLAVRSFLQENTLEGKKAFCIGTTTEKALRGYPCECAVTPTIAATIAVCLKHLKPTT